MFKVLIGRFLLSDETNLVLALFLLLTTTAITIMITTPAQSPTAP